jgi:uncharacterized protein
MIPSSPPAFHLLAKPAGASCNLACAYCFYLEKEALYPGSSLRMSDEVLEAYIQQLFAAHRAPEVAVAWQGGEPTLMGLEFFERSVGMAGKYASPGQRPIYSLQTNGLLLDDDWCAFFKEHDFLIGLSLDGPRELHDAYRRDRGGQGSFERVRAAWERLQKHKVETNILCTVQAANGEQPLEVYRFFRDELGARYVQFIPIVEREGQGVSARSVGPKQYGQFLIAVFDEWQRRDVGTVFVQAFEAALAAWCRLPSPLCIFGETCGLSLALEHNGDLYSCDHFVDPDHRLGNILEKPLKQLLVSDAQQRFGLAKGQALPSTCRGCDVRFACQGECPRNRFGEGGVNYLCTGYRAFFHHVDRPMRRMASLLRRGRPAAEVMG